MDIAIIGAGPSGMMAGIQASKNHNNNVYLFEKNEKLGKKLFITGKGRCNITNYCDLDNFKNNIVTNKKFLFHSLNEFDNIKFYDFLVDNGMELKIERGNRVFPLSDKSYELTDLYKKLLIKNNVQLKYNTNIDKILFNNNKFEIHYNNSFKLFDNVIIATGGMSYHSTGSSGDGYKFAKDFGIDIIEPKPSLVPIIVEENNELISIGRLLLKNIKIKIIDNNKTIYSDFGDIEFRNDEIAGPLIIKLSSL